MQSSSDTRIEFLTDRRDALPIIGRWYNEEWGQRLRNESLEISIQRLDEYLNRDHMPFILLITEGPEILASAQLKYREMAEMYPEKEHWLGGVFVSPRHRGRGLGSRIANEIANRAPEYGVETLFLQTEQLDGGLYRRLGWTPIEQVNNNGLEVLVMERTVSR